MEAFDFIKYFTQSILTFRINYAEIKKAQDKLENNTILKSQ